MCIISTLWYCFFPEKENHATIFGLLVCAQCVNMVLWIAHRGNVNGPLPHRENHPDYIDAALNKGYHAEIDVWMVSNANVANSNVINSNVNGIFLGHDAPQYKIQPQYLQERKHVLWCHAKNLTALIFLIEQGMNTFFHDVDHYTLTSKNIIWAFPGYPVNRMSVMVMPERMPKHYKLSEMRTVYGVCTDHIETYRKKLDQPDAMDTA